MPKVKGTSLGLLIPTLAYMDHVRLPVNCGSMLGGSHFKRLLLLRSLCWTLEQIDQGQHLSGA